MYGIETIVWNTCSVTAQVSDTESREHESNQDTASTQEDSSGVYVETTVTQQGTAHQDTTHITAHQRRERTWEVIQLTVVVHNLPQISCYISLCHCQALRNLVNKSGQIALQIFNDLDRRLKSADKKGQSGVGSQMSNKTKSDHS